MRATVGARVRNTCSKFWGWQLNLQLNLDFFPMWYKPWKESDRHLATLANLFCFTAGVDICGILGNMKCKHIPSFLQNTPLYMFIRTLRLRFLEKLRTIKLNLPTQEQSSCIWQNLWILTQFCCNLTLKEIYSNFA